MTSESIDSALINLLLKINLQENILPPVNNHILKIKSPALNGTFYY